MQGHMFGSLAMLQWRELSTNKTVGNLCYILWAFRM